MQYGAPGSGKTSIIHSLAGELGLDVYAVSLSRMGLDDTALSELISDLPRKFSIDLAVVVSKQMIPSREMHCSNGRHRRCVQPNSQSGV